MASAQQVPGMPRVIQLAPADVPSLVEATRAGLRELGYVEGRNIRLKFRNAAGNVDALPALAQEIVRDGGVDAILAISTLAALAAHKATQTIPIVAFGAVDPVGAGLADSLARPGRNVTGITVFAVRRRATVMNTGARCPATVPAMADVARRGRKGLGDPAFRACSITDRAAWDGRTGGDAQG